MPLDSAGPPNSVATTQHDDRALRLRFLRLDAPARARLRGLKPLIEAALPRVSEAFYQLFGQVPALAAMFGGAARVARLRITLADHWSRLFNGDFDDAYVEHAVSIGAAHARIGLEPRWYIAGYCLSLESIIEVVVKRHRAKPALAADIAVLLRAAFLDMDLALSSYQRSDEVERVSDEMNGLADVLDRELQLAVGEISLQTERLVEAGRGLSDIAADMRGMTEQVRDGIGTTSTTIGTVASASQELEASSREITAQVDRAAEVSLQTVEAADETGRTMADLARSVDQINGVVRLVQSIAARTKLLALNATIEAARAGNTGRGFAVVASEVKELARQTDEAIGTVSGRAGDIKRATEGAAGSVASIGERIRGVSAIAADVANSASQQREATGEIARSVELAAGHTATVADRTASLTARALATEQTAVLFRDLSTRLSTGIIDLAARLSLILRTSEGGTRRREAREPMCVEGSLQVGTFRAQGWTGDLSPSGALLVHEAPESLAGAEGELELVGIGKLRVRIAAVSPIGIHLVFRSVSKDVASAIAARITFEQQRGAAYIGMVQKAAAAASAAFEAAVSRGDVTKSQLFDLVYRPIPDTDPPQVLTDATAICDRLLPDITETIKQSDPAIAFCAACDRNGYIATHNRMYSQPQKPGERAWNMANSRNRRIFDDRAGLSAGRLTQPFLVQAYPRDMGDGNRVLLKEFDAPIVVNGARWGAIRLAVKMPAP